MCLRSPGSTAHWEAEPTQDTATALAKQNVTMLTYHQDSQRRPTHPNAHLTIVATRLPTHPCSGGVSRRRSWSSDAKTVPNTAMPTSPPAYLPTCVPAVVEL